MQYKGIELMDSWRLSLSFRALVPSHRRLTQLSIRCAAIGKGMGNGGGDGGMVLHV